MRSLLPLIALCKWMYRGVMIPPYPVHVTLLVLVAEHTVPEFVDWKIITVGMMIDDSHKLLVDHFFYSSCTYTSVLTQQ
jgi:hypothetical protein